MLMKMLWLLGPQNIMCFRNARYFANIEISFIFARYLCIPRARHVTS